MEFNLPVRILEAVGFLHRAGFGSLRVYPGMNASGTAWRVNIFEDPTVSGPDTGSGHQGECIRYSSAAGLEFMGVEIQAHHDARHVAEMIQAGLPSLRLTTSQTNYVRWYAGLLEQVHTFDAVPVAYADYFDVSKGWELGWGSRRFYPEPPGQSAADS